MGITPGIIAAGATAASAASNIFGGSGGSTGGPVAPNIYQPQFQPDQDKLFNDANTGFFNNSPASYLQPYMKSVFEGGYYNPSMDWYTQAASKAGQQAQTLGGSAAGWAQGDASQGLRLQNAAGNFFGGAQQLWDQANANPYTRASNIGTEGISQGIGLNNAWAGGADANNLRQAVQPAISGIWSSLAPVQAAAGQVGQTLNPLAQSLFAPGMGLASSAYGNLANTAQSSADALLGNAGKVMTTAFDPQQALYGRTAQQLTDQTRAGLEARGIDMSGAGAGIEADALKNFNIDWQNTQLQRQLAGLQGYQGAAGQAVAGLTGAGNALNNAYQTAAGNYFGAANTAQQAGLNAALSGFGAQNTAAQNALGLTGAAYGQAGQLGANAFQLGTAAAQSPQINFQNQVNALGGTYGNLAQGLQGFGGASTAGANLLGGAYNLGSSGIQSALYGGALPFQTDQALRSAQTNAINSYINSYTQAQQPQQQAIANALQYMGLGQSAGAALASAQNQNFYANQTYNQNLASGLGSLGAAVPSIVSGIGGIFGGGGGGGGGGNLGFGAGSLLNLSSPAFGAL